MSTNLNFRSALNGFNREDVVNYIEFLTNRHVSDLSQMKAQLDAANEEIERLKAQPAPEAAPAETAAAPVEDTEALTQAKARIAELEAQVAALNAREPAPALSENAQAELEQARLDVSTEQAEALKAIKKTYSSVSKSGKESELVLRVPQRRAVNARLNAAEAYVAEAEQALRDTVLEAPYTCQVVECSVGAGARVVAGQPVGKVIPLQERMIRIPVPLEEFSALPRDEQGKVNTALTASCVLNNGKRLQWLGRVTAVDAALDSKSNSAVLIASLEPNASHVSEWQVAPVNMALQVAINVQVPVSAWIPASAVRDGSSIQVKTPSGMQERKVQVVALKDGRALVTVPEFQSGDALIL